MFQSISLQLGSQVLHQTLVILQLKCEHHRKAYMGQSRHHNKNNDINKRKREGETKHNSSNEWQGNNGLYSSLSDIPSLLVFYLLTYLVGGGRTHPMVLRDYLCLGLQSHFQWTLGDYLWHPRYEPELQPLKSHGRYVLSLLYYLSCPSIVYLWFRCYIQRCSGFTTSSACDMGNRNLGSSFRSPISQSSPLVRVVDYKQVTCLLFLLGPFVHLATYGNISFVAIIVWMLLHIQRAEIGMRLNKARITQKSAFSCYVCYPSHHNQV